MNSLNTPPFLCPSKTVWFKHFKYFDKTQSGATKNLAAPIAPLADFIKNGIPEDINLVIDGPGVDKRNKFFKSFGPEAETHFIEKANLSDKNYMSGQLAKIKEFCRNNHINIADNAAYYLAETAGSDSSRLKSELEKLICYSADKNEITLSDCREVCSKTPEALSWVFANALTAGNTAGALEAINILTEQMRSGKSGKNSELAILSFAIKQFQEMVMARADAAELGFSVSRGPRFFYSVSREQKERYPDNILIKMNPYRAFKVCESAAAFSDREIVKALNELLETNKLLVSGGGDPRLALEQMAVCITGKK
jgi:DNA polymerase-3 subunit delta